MEAYKKVIWGSTTFAAIIVLLMAVYFFFFKEVPPSPIPEAREEQKEQPPSLQKEPVTMDPASWLPPLDIELNQSDPVIREILTNISEHPVLPGWLKTPDLIKRFTAAVDNIAGGQSPAPHLQNLRPLENFTIFEKRGSLYIDTESYKRYTMATAVFSGMDSSKLAVLYGQLAPLLDEAYKELGYPEGQFNQILARAIQVILEVPIKRGDIQVVEKVMSYAFHDPNLERLSPVQKHLLRMGPKNLAKIQEKVRQLASLLNLNQ